MILVAKHFPTDRAGVRDEGVGRPTWALCYSVRKYILDTITFLGT